MIADRPLPDTARFYQGIRLSRMFKPMSEYNLALSMSPSTRRVGLFFIDKYRSRAAESGYRTVAAQLRKQGVPLEQSLLILLGSGERFAHLHKGA